MLYLKAKKGREDIEEAELEADIEQGQKMKEKAEKERSAELWNVCMEFQ